MLSAPKKFNWRHPVGGLPSSRLLKGRGSVIPGDESTLGGEEEEEKEM